MSRPDTDRTDVDLLDLLAALRAGWRPIVLGTLVVCAAAGALSFALPDEYEAVVQLLPPKEQKKGFGFADLLSDLPIPSLRLGDKGTPADIYIAILKSPTIRRRMVEHFGLLQRYETASMEEAIESLQSKTEVGKSEQGTIMIHVLAREPQLAAAMANQYVRLLDSTNIRLSQETAGERYAFISELESREELNLQEKLARLQQFQEEHNAISLEEQARATIRMAAEMQAAAYELVIRRQALLLSGVSSDHPDVKRLERELLMRQEALAFQRDGKEATSQHPGLLKGLFLEENLFLPLRQIPEVAHEYENIEKDVLVQGALMKMLLEQKAEALIERGNQTSTVQVLDAAAVPEEPARPRRLLMVFIAGVLSAFACTVYVLGATYARSLRGRWRVEYAGRA